MNNAKQNQKTGRRPSQTKYLTEKPESVLDIKRGFTTADAATYLGVSTSHLRHSRMQPPLADGPRYTRNGRKILYLREDLDAWLNEGHVTVTENQSGDIS